MRTSSFHLSLWFMRIIEKALRVCFAGINIYLSRQLRVHKE